MRGELDEHPGESVEGDAEDRSEEGSDETDEVREEGDDLCKEKRASAADLREV